MYLQKFKVLRISYHSYRRIFVTDDNSTFGYPRYDRCSTCDEFSSQESIFKKKMTETAERECKNLILNIQELAIQNKLYKNKANVFF